MNMLALITDGFGSSGGIATYNQQFLTALSGTSVSSHVTVYPRHAGRAAPPSGISQAQPVASRLRYTARVVVAAARHGPYDGVFCGHLYMAPLACAVARYLRVPMWLQLHGIEAWERPGRLLQESVKGAAIVTAVSRYTRRRFLQWAEIDADRVRVLPNTFDPRFSPGPKPSHLVDSLNPGGRKVLLTVSRLSSAERYKGHDRVIAAMPAILSSEPRALYVIVGDGDDRQRLERLAEQMGVAASVCFVGHVADSALADYFRFADVFVMPSTGEGFGIVYLEALATGLPVVAGNADGSVDALGDGELGFLVDPLNTPQLAASIVQMLARDDRPSPQSIARFAFGKFAQHVNDLSQGLAV